MDLFKEQVIEVCRVQLNHKISDLSAALKEVVEAGNMETKSTAGDKHETGRAMMQLEQEKLGKQIQDAETQLNEFEKVDFRLQSDKIVLGSLVQTNRGFFLVAVSIGKMDVEGKIVFAISLQSPLGKALLGKKQNETLVFNGISYQIEAVH